jgi:hypothetical protein
MARSGHVLVGLLLGAAAAAVALTAVSFVSPFAGPRSSSQLQRAALAGEEAPAEVFEQREFEPVAAVASTEEAAPSFLKWVGAGLLAGVIMAVSAGPASAKYFDTAGLGWGSRDFSQWSIAKSRWLEPCKDNKKFHKKIKDNIYKITQRQKKYPKNGLIWKRFDTQIFNVKRRENAYGDRYCGKKDGNPRAIVTGELVRGNIVVPGIMFLYTAGWIGWAGREYLQRASAGKDYWKEMLIDVPLATRCMASGFAWPVNAWQDIVDGKFVKKDSEIYPNVHGYYP